MAHPACHQCGLAHRHTGWASCTVALLNTTGQGSYAEIAISLDRALAALQRVVDLTEDLGPDDRGGMACRVAREALGLPDPE